MLQINSIAVDIAIILDFMLYEGRHAANLVGFVSLMILVLLGYAAVCAGRGRVMSQMHVTEQDRERAFDHYEGENIDTGQLQGSDLASQSTNPMSEPGTTQLIEKLTSLLIDDGLYADTELNLQRFARKAGVPARTISRTINVHTGQNISQWVNAARISAVCSLLENKDKTISDAMFESGFLTKSNFNREFRRIKGISPSEWREKYFKNTSS